MFPITLPVALFFQTKINQVSDVGYETDMKANISLYRLVKGSFYIISLCREKSQTSFNPMK